MHTHKGRKECVKILKFKKYFSEELFEVTVWQKSFVSYTVRSPAYVLSNTLNSGVTR